MSKELLLPQDDDEVLVCTVEDGGLALFSTNVDGIEIPMYRWGYTFTKEELIDLKEFITGILEDVNDE